EEAAGDELDRAGEQRLVAVGFRQIESDPAQPGPTTEQLGEQRAVAAADIDHDVAVVPLGLHKQLCTLVLPADHGAVEGAAFCRMCREPAPEIRAERAREARVPRGVRLAAGAVPAAAEQVRGGTPVRPAQQL